MMLCRWEDLPEAMQVSEVRKYYDILKRKRRSLVMKRIFDVIVSLAMLIVLNPVFLILAIMIKIDSPGPVFFRQVRVTQYGKQFKIFKFRTMTADAEKKGTQITVGNDVRITRIGQVIRKYRLDEIPQLIDILRGTMTFVGTRPEVPKYVDAYTPEMMATLLLPAGVTSLTSIYYADESKLLGASEDPDKVYIEDVLPEKMFYNLRGIEHFSCRLDLKLMVMTVLAMLGKNFVREI